MHLSRRATGVARVQRTKISAMNRQEELAVGRRLLGHIDGRTTDLADALFRNRVVGLFLPRARRPGARPAVPRAADLHGPVDAAAQARRLPHRGRGRHAGADDPRRRRRGPRLRQHLPPSRRAGGAGLRQRPRLRLPLSRLDLRLRRQASGHHRQGGLRRHRSREPRPGAPAGGGAPWHDVRAAQADRRGRERRRSTSTPISARWWPTSRRSSWRPIRSSRPTASRRASTGSSPSTPSSRAITSRICTGKRSRRTSSAMSARSTAPACTAACAWRAPRSMPCAPLPEGERNYRPHVISIYQLFPNTILIWQVDHIEIWRAFPDRDDAEPLRRRDDDLQARTTATGPTPTGRRTATSPSAR